MGRIFGGKPKKVAQPALPSPQAIPEVEPAAEEGAMKRYRRRKGFEKQIITGELVPESEKKKVLG